MSKRRWLTILKVIVICVLVLAISLLSLMLWKSDTILHAITHQLQGQLRDTLSYRDAQLNWFSHFPSTSVSFEDLQIGHDTSGLVSEGDLHVIIPVFPLFKNKVVVRELQLSDARINLVVENGKWSYDVLKNQPRQQDTTGWRTIIDRVSVERVMIRYNDGRDLQFQVWIEQGRLDCKQNEDEFNADVRVRGDLQSFRNKTVVLPESFPLQISGRWVNHSRESVQRFYDFTVKHPAISLTGNLMLKNAARNDEVELEVAWEKADLLELRKWIPAKYLNQIEDMIVSGESTGTLTLSGPYSGNAGPQVTMNARIKKGAVSFNNATSHLEGLQVDMAYHSSDPDASGKSKLVAGIEQKTLLGKNLKANIEIINLDAPLYSVSLDGPALVSLFQPVLGKAWQLNSGEVEFINVHANNISSTHSNSQLASRLSGKITFKNAEALLKEEPFELANTQIEFDGEHSIRIQSDQWRWDKVVINNLQGKLQLSEDAIGIDLAGELCSGNVDMKGALTNIKAGPTLDADWVAQSIRMDQLLTSFDNFDQTFMTSSNLEGSASIWAETVIPMTRDYTVRSKEVRVKSALEIRDGRLKQMNVLEDFSDYVHLEDLRDIRFNQLRNYLKIENGQVYLPVMFIQSSAMNLSINGVHGFDHKILYNLKINAGQTLSNKLKKRDVRQPLVPSRKSGWINLYFTLGGTVDAVNYAQDRRQVISGFEQSTVLKENLRKELVDKFGYDVYWLEPNEWEDIPEYR